MIELYALIYSCDSHHCLCVSMFVYMCWLLLYPCILSLLQAREQRERKERFGLTKKAWVDHGLDMADYDFEDTMDIWRAEVSWCFITHLSTYNQLYIICIMIQHFLISTRYLSLIYLPLLS